MCSFSLAAHSGVRCSPAIPCENHRIILAVSDTNPPTRRTGHAGILFVVGVGGFRVPCAQDALGVDERPIDSVLLRARAPTHVGFLFGLGSGLIDIRMSRTVVRRVYENRQPVRWIAPCRGMLPRWASKQDWCTQSSAGYKAASYTLTKRPELVRVVHPLRFVGARLTISVWPGKV